MIEYYLALASGLISTVYGGGEMFCGDIGKAVPCAYGAVTASGEVFDPTVPMAAIAAPSGVRLRSRMISLKIPGGECQPVLLADKMNPRWIGSRGFDLTPAAVALLTGGDKGLRWSGRVQVCDIPAWKKVLYKHFAPYKLGHYGLMAAMYSKPSTVNTIDIWGLAVSDT